MSNSCQDKEMILRNVKAREIVSEIMNFGVSQEQIKTIIKLLALELENRAMMLSLIESLREDDAASKQELEV